MEITIILGNNSFSVKDLPLDEHLVSIFRIWVGAQDNGETAVTIETLTEQLEENTQQLEAAVTATTPATP